MVDTATAVSVAKWSCTDWPEQPLPQMSTLPYRMRQRPPTLATTMGVPAGALTASRPLWVMFWSSMVIRFSPSGVRVVASAVASTICTVSSGSPVVEAVEAGLLWGSSRNFCTVRESRVMWNRVGSPGVVMRFMRPLE